SYAEWYQSPLLAEGLHILNITNAITGNLTTFVDFMTVTPGNSTKLDGRTLMVDDTYSGIEYDSNWSMVNDSAATSDYAFQGTTHLAYKPGSTFSFSYAGTNMTLYGVFRGDKVGSLDIAISVDEQPSIHQSYNASSAEFSVPQPNFALFSTGDFDAGTHTVTVNLTRCENQLLVLDYILYTPSFSTLATMPNLTNSITPSTTLNDTNKKPIAAIVGGTVGGVVLLSLFGLLFAWRWKHRRAAPTVDPFPVNAYTFHPSPTEASFNLLTSTPDPAKDQVDAKTEPDPLFSTGTLRIASVSRSTVTENDPGPREELLIRQIQVLNQELDTIVPPPDYDSKV
ncbi:hypothetical protein C8J56DRAFT_795901, partial [Mycena floridula]